MTSYTRLRWLWIEGMHTAGLIAAGTVRVVQVVVGLAAAAAVGFASFYFVGWVFGFMFGCPLAAIVGHAIIGDDL